jgi:hypothetical protein
MTLNLGVSSGSVNIPSERISDGGSIYLTGELTGSVTINMPKLTGSWYFVNSATGAYPIIVNMAGAAGAATLSLGPQWVTSDGVNLWNASANDAGVLGQILALLNTGLKVKPLLAAGVGYSLTTTDTSDDTALTAGIKAVSIYARNSDAYFSIGDNEQTASSSTAFIASGERLDFDVSRYATPHIAVIYGPSAVAAVLQVTELS